MSGTESEGVNVGDEEQALAVAEAAKDAKEEKQADAVEASNLKRKIGKRREKKTIHIRVEGARVPFAPPGGEADAIMDMMGEFGDLEEDELSGDQWQQYAKARDRIVSILGDKCKVDDLDSEWWRQTFSFTEREELFGDLAAGGIEGNQQRS
jgi:hypothetical protein